jgi:hypothetical protein
MALGLFAFSLPLQLNSQVVVPDSSQLHERARKAQREFEFFHRDHLPHTAYLPQGRCDEYVGRLCLTGSDLSWNPSPEASTIVEAREVLLAKLAEVNETLPGDHWVFGQRIRYMGDMGRWEEAMAIAEECQHPRPWWCQALQGYVLHRAGKVVESLEAFSMALQGMTPERAEDWMDPGPLLDYPADRWMANPEGVSSSAALNWFWAMADPLFLTPGNEGLSEHYARRFAPALYQKTSITMGLPWGRAFEELLLRYGFVAGWERTPGPPGEAGLATVVQHRHPESRGHLPPFEALRHPAGLQEGDWVPQDEHPRNASAPIHAPLLALGQGQVTVLRRGGDLLILAAYGIPEDTVFTRRRGLPTESGSGQGRAGGDTVSRRRPLGEPLAQHDSRDTLAGLFILPTVGDPVPLSVIGRGGTGVLQLTAPPGSYLLSLEQWSPSERWGARIRLGIESEAIPPDVPHLSDLLLLAPSETPPAHLGEAIPLFLSSSRIPSGGRFTVAWEVNGLGGRAEPMTFRLSLEKGEGNFFHRTLESIGLFRKDPPLNISWKEEETSGWGHVFRAVEIELPPLKAGRYQLRLEMSLPNRSPVVASRPLFVF